MTIHSFHARNDQHRSAVTWENLLRAARDEHEIVLVARDFVASFTPYEIELLPPGCRPAKLVDGTDIANYGYDLMLHRWGDDAAGETVRQAFAQFFVGATERLATVARKPSDQEPESASG